MAYSTMVGLRRSYFSNKLLSCVNKPPCHCGTIPGSSASYLHFALRPSGIRSSVEFREALCACKLGAGERVETVW